MPALDPTKLAPDQLVALAHNNYLSAKVAGLRHALRALQFAYDKKRHWIKGARKVLMPLKGATLTREGRTVAVIFDDALAAREFHTLIHRFTGGDRRNGPL